MRLSEAIRLGAMLKPQKHGPPSGVLEYQPSTCALAAAAEAFGRKMLNVTESCYVYPSNYARCPVTGCARLDGSIPFFGIVAHLNDDHRWTREAIADWVETLEPKAVPEPEPERATVSQ